MDEVKLLDTPFAGRQTTLGSPRRVGRSVLAVVSIAGALFVVIGVLWASGKGSNDRYRTLEAFPAADFFENHESLSGGTFKLSATVDAELGTEEGRGRLVTFRDTQSKKVLPVMIPSGVMPGHALSKSQRYKMVIEVNRRGVLTAIHLEKE